MADPKRVLLAVLVGGVVLFASGYLIFNVLFAAFYTANAGSATSVDRDSPLMWALVTASCAYAALIVYAIGTRNLSIGQGAVVGSVVGCLLWLTTDLYLYGATNVANLTRTAVDPVLEFIHGGIGGAAIAAVLGRRGGSHA
jgi:hypothetical protein